MSVNMDPNITKDTDHNNMSTDKDKGFTVQFNIDI